VQQFKSLSSLTREQDEERKEAKRTIKEIDIHQENAKIQRANFKQQIAHLSDLSDIKKEDDLQDHSDEGVIIFDFKENLQCGSSPNETNTDFYEKFSTTCFGVIVFHLKDIYIFDYLSADVTHDAHFVSNALSNLFQNPNFKNLNIKKLSIWSDGASHFKNNEITHFYNTVQQNFSKFQWNYFTPYHGKNYCDSHFSVIGRIVKKYENNEGKIDSLQKLCTTLEEKFNSFKNNYQFDYSRKKEKKKFENAKIFVIPIEIPQRDKMKNQIIIPNIKSYFSFEFSGNSIFTRESTSSSKTDKKVSIVLKQKARGEKNKEASANKRKKLLEELSISIGSSKPKKPRVINAVAPLAKPGPPQMLSFIDEELTGITKKRLSRDANRDEQLLLLSPPDSRDANRDEQLLLNSPPDSRDARDAKRVCYSRDANWDEQNGTNSYDPMEID
jgi:hypothetical protein